MTVEEGSGRKGEQKGGRKKKIEEWNRLVGMLLY